MRRYLNALSPIELFNGQQWQKAMHGNFFSTLGSALKENSMTAARIATENPGQFTSGMKDYFGGYSANIARDATKPVVRNFRANVRRGVAGAAGAYVGANIVLGGGNPISSTIGGVTRFGAHAGVALGLSRIHPLAGIAYAGLGVINSLRSGNNLGPY